MRREAVLKSSAARLWRMIEERTQPGVDPTPPDQRLWDPFRAEWVLFTSHRGARPWIGEVVVHDEVSVPAESVGSGMVTRSGGR